jgi:hypothetical protein
LGVKLKGVIQIHVSLFNAEESGSNLHRLLLDSYLNPDGVFYSTLKHS